MCAEFSINTGESDNLYKYIFFDLDGTLTDPGEGITKSVEYALGKYGITVDDRSSLYSFIGPPLFESFMKYYGFSREKAFEAVSYYREYFAETGLFENRPYEGIYDVLGRIRESGRTMVIATSKPEVYTERILERFGLSQYFDFVAGATLDSSRVNKSDVIAYAMKISGAADPSEILMIGDRSHDVTGACDNGIDCAGVLYGYGDREELEAAGARYILDRPEDILMVV